MESQELLGLFSFEEEHQLPAATLNYFPFCLPFSFLSNRKSPFLTLMWWLMTLEMVQV